MRRREKAERVLREREQARSSQDTIVNPSTTGAVDEEAGEGGREEDPNTFDALHNRVINDAEHGGKKNRMVSEKVGKEQTATKEEIRNSDLQDANLDEENEMPPESDPNIVTWYGPTDPANPMKWVDRSDRCQHDPPSNHKLMLMDLHLP